VQARRPLKRPFAELEEEDTGDEPTSDELYGWVEEDDEVAAEGLLIDEAAAPNPGHAAESRSERCTKMTRPSTI
jgi:hypothetical protein